MRRKLIGLSALCAVLAGTVLVSWSPANRHDSSSTPSPPQAAITRAAALQLPLPSPMVDLTPALCAPELVSPEALGTVPTSDLEMATFSRGVPSPHPVFTPVLPNLRPVTFEPASPEQAITLPQFNEGTADTLADALDRKVKVAEHEAAVIRILDAKGNLLASRTHERTVHSPAAGAVQCLVVYSAYAANNSGGIATNGFGEPLPAANAVPVGSVEVSNACSVQNLRIALEGLDAFVACLN